MGACTKGRKSAQVWWQVKCKRHGEWSVMCKVNKGVSLNVLLDKTQRHSQDNISIARDRPRKSSQVDTPKQHVIVTCVVGTRMANCGEVCWHLQEENIT